MIAFTVEFAFLAENPLTKLSTGLLPDADSSCKVIEQSDRDAIGTCSWKLRHYIATSQ